MLRSTHKHTNATIDENDVDEGLTKLIIIIEILNSDPCEAVS